MSTDDLKRDLYLQKFMNSPKACYFQPFYSVEKQCVWGAEALFRMQASKEMFYDTEQIILEAEKLDCISLIDKWMFEQICQYIPVFRKFGLKRINLNLSPDELKRQQLIGRILTKLKECGISKTEICFEITETCSESDNSFLLSNIKELNQTGIRLAMDDFGKGESNLLRILKIPFATLKLDKEIIWSMEESRQAEIIIEGLISIAHKLGVRVTAEGVETKEQALLLKSFGCDYLQGYLISKPLSYKDFIIFLQDNRDRDFLK